MASPEGCPIKKFPPILNAAYAPDREVKPKEHGPVGNCGTCGKEALPPVTWGEVVKQFAKAVNEWRAAGMPLASHSEWFGRIGKCRDCNHYGKFYCKHCKCLIHIKAKLATEACPIRKWLPVVTAHDGHVAAERDDSVNPAAGDRELGEQ